VHAVQHDGVQAEEVDVAREVDLGAPGAFADMLVRRPGRPPYFLEVKYGYASDRLVHHLQHKYGTASTTVPDADRVVLLIDRATRPDSSALFAACAPPSVLSCSWRSGTRPGCAS